MALHNALPHYFSLPVLYVSIFIRLHIFLSQGRYRDALNIKHRVLESMFLLMAENLIDVQDKYKDFIDQVRFKTQRFESSLIQPIVNSMNALIDIFSVSMTLCDGISLRGQISSGSRVLDFKIPRGDVKIHNSLLQPKCCSFE